MPETKRKPTPRKRAASKKKAPPTANKLTAVLVWDMSYSMMDVWDATVEGFNDYVAGLKREEADLRKEYGDEIYTRFSLTVFDTVFEEWYIACPIDELPGIGKDRYIPRGSTALYDAIANTIASTEKRLRDEGVEDEKVLVVVMTDGEENASKEFNRYENGAARLLELIEIYQNKGNWTFSFLGANIDAVAAAGAIGIAAGNVAQYSSDSASVASASASLATATSGRRSSTAGSTSSLFADSGLGQDYRSPGASGAPGPVSLDPSQAKAPVWDDKSQRWRGDASGSSRKARRGS